MAQRKHKLAAIAGGQRAEATPPSVFLRASALVDTSPASGGGKRIRAAAVVEPNLVREDADHFITREGFTFAGSHLIIDLWDAEGLDDHARIEKAMRDAVDAAGATLLHIHLHTFTPNGGISGVAVLAESHISVHTWPERGYAAFDVFMCGDAEPKKALKVLEQAFAPKRTIVGVHKRGVL
jgi:S-adenosylmethionine decarboxylase